MPVATPSAISSCKPSAANSGRATTAPKIPDRITHIADNSGTPPMPWATLIAIGVVTARVLSDSKTSCGRPNSQPKPTALTMPTSPPRKCSAPAALPRA